MRMVHRSRVRGAWMHSPLLTRRAFLGGLSLSTLALASIYRTIRPPRPPRASPAPAEDGDAIEIPPSPPPLRVVSADPDDAAATAAARALRDFLGERRPDRPILYGAGDEDAPRVTVGAVAGSVGYLRQRVTQYLAPVTNWRLPLRYLEPAELAGILSGRFADWSQVGCATPGAIERLDFGPAGAVAVPGVERPIAPAARYDDYEALVRGLDEHPNGVALAPLGAIDFRVQALAIGDLDPLAGRGDLASYPLKRELWLGWDAALGDGFREIVIEFAARQALALDGAPPGNPLNVTVAGDIIFGRTVHSRMVRYGDWAHPLRAVATRLRSADLTVADLE